MKNLKRLNQIFPDHVLEAAKQYQNATAFEICEKLIKPNLDAINTKTGQQNDARYLSYVIEYVLNMKT